MKHRPHLAGAVVAIAAGALLAACSGNDVGGDIEDYGSESIVPAETPEGWQVHEAGPVAIAMPAGWVEAERPTTEDEGVEAWAFTDGEPVEGENTHGMTVVVSATQDDDMLTQTDNSLMTAERAWGAVDGRTEAVSWPDATDAAYSTYMVAMPVGSEDGEQIRFETLGVVAGSEQAFVRIYGPDATYDADGVHQVLESVTVQ